MYQKIRNSLASLGMVLAMFTGGLLLSEPLPSKAAAAPSPDAEQVQATIALISAAIALAHAVQQAEAAAPAAAPERHVPERSPSRLKLELGMPYYSFGTVLPRRRES